MENTELYHWGIRGMKWGIRRYQNKDGSLTPAGRKRYNDDDGSSKNEETVEEKRDRLLKSTNAKEIYEGRNLLTTAELNERINRIDTEARLQSKIPQEKKKTVLDSMDKGREYVNKSTELYKSVDSAFKSVVDSAIGKTLAKKLGIDVPKEKWIDQMMRKYRSGSLNANEMAELNRYRSAEAQIQRRATTTSGSGSTP